MASLGLTGLSLSRRDTQIIKKASLQAPYGKGTQTVVDEKVRDTLQIDLQRIQFTDPAWKPYVGKALGAAVSTTPPQCELFKVFLTEKLKGMFAMIIIVLPSQYSGGQVRLSHEPSHEIFDLSSSFTFTTSVLAWYADVYHKVKPVTSEFRLELSYNLVHTPSSIPPSLPNTNSAVNNLHHIFRKWMEENIVYLPDHGYSEYNLKTTALKGISSCT
ncbi:hypothetical protein BS17DRAFT_799884 [Gyrodon lividus]|nr:hypothetical protein BS17DRAFT_799884 [Gyrodon lividus]